MLLKLTPMGFGAEPHAGIFQSAANTGKLKGYARHFYYP